MSGNVWEWVQDAFPIMPALGFIVAKALRLPPDLGKMGRFPISGLLGGIDRTAGNREASHFFAGLNYLAMQTE